MRAERVRHDGGCRYNLTLRRHGSGRRGAMVLSRLALADCRQSASHPAILPVPPVARGHVKAPAQIRPRERPPTRAVGAGGVALSGHGCAADTAAHGCADHQQHVGQSWPQRVSPSPLRKTTRTSLLSTAVLRALDFPEYYLIAPASLESQNTVDWIYAVGGAERTGPPGRIPSYNVGRAG